MNRYMDEDLIRRRLETESHRAIVGGMWDVIGPLQREFLIGQGLATHHRLLDVGCGALRGGAPLTAFLDPGRYYGIDISTLLLDAGYEREIVAAGLDARLPRSNLFATDDFEVPFGVSFDFGLAVSLFTHLPLSLFSRCLVQLAPHFPAGRVLFATVFEGRGTIVRPSGVTTYEDRDPFHVTRDQLAAATPAGWTLGWIGDWGHPRDQQMVRLTRDA